MVNVGELFQTCIAPRTRQYFEDGVIPEDISASPKQVEEGSFVCGSARLATTERPAGSSDIDVRTTHKKDPESPEAEGTNKLYNTFLGFVFLALSAYFMLTSL